MNFWRSTAYRILLYGLSPLLLAHTIRQSIVRKGGWQFIAQRMGWFAKNDNPAVKSIWIHAASVGEARALIPLLAPLQKNLKTSHFTLTCNTPEAYQILASVKNESTALRYCAIDFPGATKKIFALIRPSLILLVETELWPYMLSTAGKAQIPVAVINGRLSRKTLNTNKLIAGFYHDALRHVTQVFARSDADADGFRQLGVDASKIKTLGNLKNAYQSNSGISAPPELADHRYILAASTHAPEEQFFAELSRQLSDCPLLVIAPRHPQRSAEIQQYLQKREYSFAVRSLDQKITSDTRIYLADTTGELDRFFIDAELVYMGGSLSQTGGHNVLEPAAWGKAIICGPNLWNFTDESKLLSKRGALLIVDSESQMTAAIDTLLGSPGRRKQMGDAARLAVSEQAETTLASYLAEISKSVASVV